jgi:hypothetical protein
MVTPFFWHYKNNKEIKNILFPLWIQKKTNYDGYSEKINYIFPLYWSKKDKNCNNKVLFPVIWRYKNQYHQSFTLFPIFSMGHRLDKTRHHLMITPLFWEIKNRNIHKVTLIPLFYYSANSMENEKHFNILYFLARYKSWFGSKTFSFLWPICEYRKDSDLKYFRFAPVIWYKKAPESNYFSIQPLYFHSKDSTCSSYRFLWELFTYRNYFNYKTSRNVLWKAMIWDKYQNSDHEFRLLYFLYANVNKNGYFEKGIFPFYSSKKESNGNTSFSVFLSFYNSFKRQIPDSKEFYMEDKIFWFIRIRSNYKALEEKGLKYK